MWDPQYITFYFDGNVTGQQATPADMHTPMYLLADLAMQDLPGVTDNPKHLSIDYIRAYSPYFATNDAAEIAWLYYGLLDRAPDPGGLQGFANAIQNGDPLQLVAQSILGSAEYENTSIGRSNASFVQYLYCTALGRSPDASGFQGWDNALNTGTLSRANVVNGFLSSPEFQSDYAGQSNATYINAVYEVALQRPADPVGLAGWQGALSNGMSRTTFDQLVVGSPEFQSSIADPAAAAFVGTLYEQALGRAPDAPGLQGWTSALVTGNLNNVGVAIGIAESPEAQQFLSPKIELATS
jgi:hypothetical protein